MEVRTGVSSGFGEGVKEKQEKKNTRNVHKSVMMNDASVSEWAEVSVMWTSSRR